MGSSSSPLITPCGSGLASCTVTRHLHQRAGLKCQMLAKRMSSHHLFNWASGKKGDPAPAVFFLEVPVHGSPSGVWPGRLLVSEGCVSACFVSLLDPDCQWQRWCLKLSCQGGAWIHGMREVGLYSLLQGGRELHPFLPKALVYHKRALIMSIFYRMIPRFCHLIS